MTRKPKRSICAADLRPDSRLKLSFPVVIETHEPKSPAVRTAQRVTDKLLPLIPAGWTGQSGTSRDSLVAALTNDLDTMVEAVEKRAEGLRDVTQDRVTSAKALHDRWIADAKARRARNPKLSAEAIAGQIAGTPIGEKRAAGTIENVIRHHLLPLRTKSPYDVS